MRCSFLLWPYWSLLALAFEGRWFQNSGIHSAYYFLCFIAPVIFAFAAGAVSYRPPLAHAAAFMGLVAAPWIYENAMTDRGLGNTWLALNVPDNELGWYSPYYARMTILFVGLIAAAVVTAGLRLLPPPWQFLRSPIRERPGLRLLQVPSCLLSGLASQSCLIESRVRLTIPLGRRCRFSPSKSADFNSTNPVSAVGGGGMRHPGESVSVSLSGNDRRLFQYRFAERHASGQLSESLTQRVRAILPSSVRTAEKSAAVKPIRNWNADDWYFNAQGAGLKAYTTANGSAPPQEIVALFDDLEKLPRSSEGQSDRKDLCLGFCYDPLSELGFLYANHRCFSDGHGTVCR